MDYGRVLEEVSYRLLRDERDGSGKFYTSVDKNVFYKDRWSVDGEIDVLAMRHKRGKKHYIVLVECKLSDRIVKAMHQLKRSKKYMHRKYPDAKIFCIYIHNYYPEDGEYTIEWLKEV